MTKRVPRYLTFGDMASALVKILAEKRRDPGEPFGIVSPTTGEKIFFTGFDDGRNGELIVEGTGPKWVSK